MLRDGCCPRCTHIRDEIGPIRQSASEAWGCIHRVDTILSTPNLGLQEALDLVKREVFATKYPEPKDPKEEEK
jgi:hypothetical protein